MPIDGSAEVEVLVAEEIKAVPVDFVRLADDVFSLLGKPMAQGLQKLADGIRRKEKLTRSRVASLEQALREIVSHASEEGIEAFRQFLAAAI
jgi:hypothetical protein